MRIGILTGGGDCPGLNAAIRAIVRQAERNGDSCIGFQNGWKGLLDGTYSPLTRRETKGIGHLGGTILGTSRTNVRKMPGGFERVIETLETQHVDGLIAIGGEDTLGIAKDLAERLESVRIVGCPKTIDNDLSGTDYTFGFDTAVTVATEAIDRLHSTAESHQRVMVVEVMGRHTGWIALYSGVAGGADVIAIPEAPISVAEICSYISRRHTIHKRNHSIIVVAEGAKITDWGSYVTEGEALDDFGHVRLGGIGQRLTQAITEVTGIEARANVLGYLQRGGTPTPRDRWLASLFGLAAYREVQQGNTGVMVGLRGTDVVPVPLAEAVDSYKYVPIELYRQIETFFG